MRSISNIFLLFVGILLLGSSCVPQKKLVYVRETNETKDINEFYNFRGIKTIQPFDELYIKVLSTDEQTAQIFFNPAEMRMGGNVNLISYTVSDAGDIDFPFVGKIYLKGMTPFEASEVIQEALSQYLPNTSVTVKYVSNQITILGEVERPGDFAFFDDKISIYRALGLAGGVGRFGNKQNVTLIREVDNIVSYHYLDISDKRIAESDFFHLLPYDILIVEPLRAKSWSYQNVTYTTFLTTLTTFVTFLYFIQAQQRE